MKKNNIPGVPIAQTTSTSIDIGNNGSGTSYTFAGTTSGIGITNIQSTLKVNGDAEFQGDITVKGRSLTETLERVEERLAILVPNVRLEQDWKELQNLRQQYVELERKLLEQQRVFDILKKSD